MSSQTVKCGCCEYPLEGVLQWVDEDLGEVVCPECKTLLRWAKAWLSKAGLKYCERVKR
jgi:hypothetical protein